MKIASTLLVALVQQGSRVTHIKKITSKDIQTFSELTGDFNPVHSGEHGVVHGVLLNGFVSAVLGTRLPGPGYLVTEQSLKFPSSCHVGDEIEISVEVTEARKIVSCLFICTNINDGKVVLQGSAKLIKSKTFGNE